MGNWLFTAARNRVTDYYRKRKTIPFSRLAPAAAGDDDEEASKDLFFDAWASQYLPDAWVESREFWETLDRALEQLPPEQREVFVANELYDVPFKQMAEETGLSINTLLSRKRYAVLQLRRHFSGDEGYFHNNKKKQ